MTENWPYRDRPTGYHNGQGVVYKTKWGTVKCTPFLVNNTPKVNNKEPALVRMFGWR